LCAVVVVYLLLCAATIHALKPWCDEAYNASAAMMLVNHGYMGVPNFELVTAESYPGVDRHWYWQMPFYPVALAGWYVITGQGIYQQRIFTLLQAVVVLACIYLILRRLSNSIWTAVGAVAILSLDYFFVQRSCDGRYDMLCASCGFAGLAGYVCWRERSGVVAALVGSAGIVGAVMTHPIGVLFGAQLLYLFVRYDLRRVRWGWVGAALVPALAAGLLWGAYIEQDPASFRAQFLRSAADRATFTKNPVEGLKREFRTRYLFGLGGIDSSRVDGSLRSLRGLILVVYVAGLLLALFWRRLRATLAINPIVHLWAIGSVVLLVMDSGTRPLYLLHVLPWLAALLSASCVFVWTEFPRARFGVAAVMGIFLLVQLLGIGYVIHRNNWQGEYTPVASYLRDHLKPNELVLASAEYGFTLGFGRQQLVDDPCLGYYSKKIPNYIVLDLRYSDQIEWYKREMPVVYESIQKKIDGDYTLVKSAGLSKVYHLKNANVVN
jgi:hypothetical protein